MVDARGSVVPDATKGCGAGAMGAGWAQAGSATSMAAMPSAEKCQRAMLDKSGELALFANVEVGRSVMLPPIARVTAQVKDF
jgi:hypothetical protein